MSLFKKIFESRALMAAALFAPMVFSSRAGADSTNVEQTPQPSVRRPSIILIVADDLGAGDLGCYGQKQILTPSIDKLASEGMMFRQFYGGASEGPPSRASLLTGRTSGHLPIRGPGKGVLGVGDRTLGEVLRPAGYFTGFFGEWGLGEQQNGDLPVQRGFDEWFGYLRQADAEQHFPACLNRADMQFETNAEHNKDIEIPANFSGQRGKYACDFFTDAAKNLIRVGKPEAYNHYRPFFIELAYNIPSANKAPGVQAGNRMETPDDMPYSDKPWPQPEKNKAAMISRLDRYVGALLEDLKKEKIENNTLIIFTSANGPHKDGGVDPEFFKSAGGLKGLKGDVYEGGIRVPLIAWWYGRIKPGSVSDVPFALYDLLPTLTEAAQGKIPKGIDGISFLPTLTGKEQKVKHDFLYWESHHRGFHQAARMQQWKGLRHGADGPLELYDLSADAGETNNVAATNPEIAAKLTAYLDAASSADPNWPAMTVSEMKEIGPEKEISDVVPANKLGSFIQGGLVKP